MWAAEARDDQEIEEWHFNILGVDVSADDATVKKAYKAQILQAHPDRTSTTSNAVVRTQMLNEANKLLLNSEKRQEFESRSKPVASHTTIYKNNVVMLHSLNTKRYNLMYGRVVSDNLSLSVAFGESKYTIKTQHSRLQYDVHNARDDSETLNVSSLLIEQHLCRVYGEAERKESDERWSTYFAEDDRVTINRVKEAPWYNGMEATIVGYNYDLMRFDVLLDGKVLAFMTHSIQVSKARVQMAEAVPDVPTGKTRSRESSPAAGDKPGLIKASAGETVEVRCHNEKGDAGDEHVRKVRKTTWHVGVVIAINDNDDGVTTYDVKMPDSFAKKPGAVVRGVKSSDIQPRRKRGKRPLAEH